MATANTKRKTTAQKVDLYTTPRVAMIKLHKYIGIPTGKSILEPCCGKGHISKYLKAKGYNVYSTDLYDHGYGDKVGIDFLTHEFKKFDMVITNPPYKHAEEFLEKSLLIAKVTIMLLRINFLESAKRRELLKRSHLRYVYCFSKRIGCKNQDTGKLNKAVFYAWFVFDNDYNGEPIIRWI